MIRASIDLHDKGMDYRVKPGDDDPSGSGSALFRGTFGGTGSFLAGQWA
jgi:hypothetical protein